MTNRKSLKTKKTQLALVASSAVILAVAIICDLIWSSSIMRSSIDYAARLQQHSWLEYPMYFFSYILFFSVFGCNPSPRL